KCSPPSPGWNDNSSRTKKSAGCWRNTPRNGGAAKACGNACCPSACDSGVVIEQHHGLHGYAFLASGKAQPLRGGCLDRNIDDIRVEYLGNTRTNRPDVRRHFWRLADHCDIGVAETKTALAHLCIHLSQQQIGRASCRERV